VIGRFLGRDGRDHLDLCHLTNRIVSGCKNDSFQFNYSIDLGKIYLVLPLKIRRLFSTVIGETFLVLHKIQSMVEV